MAETPPIRADSVVTLRRWTVLREAGRDPILGCPEARAFVEVEETAIQAVRALDEEGRPSSAAARLEEQTGRSWDVVELAEFLRERGFVDRVDGVRVATDVKAPHLDRVKASWLTWMRHPATWIAAGAVFALAATLACLEPGSRATRADLFPFGSHAFNILGVLLFMLANSSVHELAHLLMARSFGAPARWKVGHRFHIIVLETDVTAAWGLPRAQRIAVFLAGMGYNALAWSACTIALVLHAWGAITLPDAGVSALRFAAMLNQVSLAFQLIVWARTDLHFVLAAITNERHLREEAIAYLQRLALALVSRIPGIAMRECVACGARRPGHVVACPACGATAAAAGAGMPLRRRLTFLTYGVLAVAVGPVLIAFLVMTTSFFQLESARRISRELAVAAAGGSGWEVFGAALALGLVLAQLVFVVVFLGPPIVRAARRLGGVVLRAVWWFSRRRPGSAPAVEAGAARRRAVIVALLLVVAGSVAAVGPVGVEEPPEPAEEDGDMAPTASPSAEGLEVGRVERPA